MRIHSSVVRSGILFGLSLCTYLLEARPAAAEVPLVEKGGFTFFTDGRINAFFSQGIGDDFPAPTPNPNGATLSHTVTGGGNPFTAGYQSTNQADATGKYNGQRIRSGFLATVLGFGGRHTLSEDTTIEGYIALWGTAETYARDRTLDIGSTKSKGFDVRAGYIDVLAPWGTLRAGRQSGIFGGISTEIDFLYAHNYGLGLPCLDDFYASCGHIGTGALGPGFAAGFVYTTPSVGGLKLQVGLFDPVRLLGAWERTPYPRPEGTLIFEQKLSPAVNFKLAAEGMYQPVAQKGGPASTTFWGVAGGGRLEAGPLRLGASVFRGRGLGAYVAIQNSPSSFNGTTNELRYFTGLYAQSALVFGRWQISLGAGRVIDDLLDVDRRDFSTSNLKAQTGVSAGLFYSVTDNLTLGFDYFRFQTDWWGAPNSTLDSATQMIVAAPGGGLLPGEQQVINFYNAGATFHW